MKTILLAGVEPDRAKELRGDFISSQFIRKRIREVLTQKIEDNRKSQTLKVKYENPSWAYEQADAIGYERAMRELISLLDDE